MLFLQGISGKKVVLFMSDSPVPEFTARKAAKPETQFASFALLQTVDMRTRGKGSSSPHKSYYSDEMVLCPDSNGKLPLVEGSIVSSFTDSSGLVRVIRSSGLDTIRSLLPNSPNSGVLFRPRLLEVVENELIISPSSPRPISLPPSGNFSSLSVSSEDSLPLLMSFGDAVSKKLSFSRSNSSGIFTVIKVLGSDLHCLGGIYKPDISHAVAVVLHDETASSGDYRDASIYVFTPNDLPILDIGSHDLLKMAQKFVSKLS
jgi:hypothetical protein